LSLSLKVNIYCQAQIKIDACILRKYLAKDETKQKRIECCNQRGRIAQVGKEEPADEA
jgi:hypothetical protein